MRPSGCASFVVALALISGCETPPEIPQHRTLLQSDAGSVDVAVLSVTDWEAYRDALSPRFRLDGEAALGKVLPTTAQIEQRILDAVSARLGIKFAVPAAGAEPTVQEAQAPGRPLQEENPAASRGTTAPTLEDDPILQYQVATALVQEAAMLNRYVEDARVWADHDAYLVRLQVGIMPRRRYQPYDVSTTISFLPPAEKEISHELVAARKDGAGGFPTIHAVPLLVTDNIEAIARVRSETTIREVALALAGSAPGIGGSLAFDQRLAWIEDIFARDLNSLLTVTRASENAVRVRFGARMIGHEAYSQTAQTHSVTVLLLVPRTADSSQQQLRVIARSEFIDAESGVALDEPAREDLLNRGAIAVERYNRGRTQKIKTVIDRRMFSRDLEALVDAAGNGDVGRFYSFFYDSASTRALMKQRYSEWTGVVPLLWSDLVAAHEGNRFASATLPLPARCVSALPSPATVAFLSDDGKVTRTFVRGGKDLRGPEISAALILTIGAETHEVRPDSVRVDRTGRDVALEFPSLVAAGVPKADAYEVSLAHTMTSQKYHARYATLTAKSATPLLVEPNATSIKVTNKSAAIGLRLSRDKAAHASLGEGTPLGMQVLFAKIEKTDQVEGLGTLVRTDAALSFANAWLDGKPAVVLTLNDVMPGTIVLRPLAGGRPAGSDIVITVQ
jgi:hypothetical protein